MITDRIEFRLGYRSGSLNYKSKKPTNSTFARAIDLDPDTVRYFEIFEKGTFDEHTYSFAVEVIYDPETGEIDGFTKDFTPGDLSELSWPDSNLVLRNLESFWVRHVGLPTYQIDLHYNSRYLSIPKRYVNSILHTYNQTENRELIVDRGVIFTNWQRVD